jgi:hypothetical protein
MQVDRTQVNRRYEKLLACGASPDKAISVIALTRNLSIAQVRAALGFTMAQKLYDRR